MMKISIIGNSKRHKILYENLLKQGFDINNFENFSDIPIKLDSDFVVLPIPTLKTNGKINLNEETEHDVNEILEKGDENTVFISCNYSNESYNVIDINRRDDFAFLNAIPTAEGAIKIAVENLDTSLFFSNILITGFGRVGKILADRLKGLSPNITIAVRSLKDRVYTKSLGYNVCDFKTIKSNLNKYNVVFQTVPTLVLTKDILDNLNKKAVIIELSSKSLGTDFKYAEKIGIKVIHAPALPEKTAPTTAGDILTETVTTIISEQTTQT